MLSARARRRWAAALAVAALTLTSSAIGSAAAVAVPPLPSRMAAIGDSISQATMSCGSLYACPTNSWATGSATSVSSHAARLRAAGATALATANYSVPGTVASALPAQAQRAVSFGANYVTVQIGANDACAKNVSSMTSTASFEVSVRSTLSTLAAGSSKPEIFVASIPNIQRMYDLNKGSQSARLTWGALKTCQSMLANPTSTSSVDVRRRAAVQQRVNEYNAVLAGVCAQTAKCRWDGNATADYAFSKSEISTKDYFHPSTSGQATLARISWARSQWVS